MAAARRSGGNQNSRGNTTRRRDGGAERAKGRKAAIETRAKVKKKKEERRRTGQGYADKYWKAHRDAFNELTDLHLMASGFDPEKEKGPYNMPRRAVNSALNKELMTDAKGAYYWGAYDSDPISPDRRRQTHRINVAKKMGDASWKRVESRKKAQLKKREGRASTRNAVQNRAKSAATARKNSKSTTPKKGRY